MFGLSKRELNLILVMLCIGILAVSFLFVYKPMTKSLEAQKSELDGITMDKTQKDTVIVDTQYKEEQISTVIGNLITVEDTYLKNAITPEEADLFILQESQKLNLVSSTMGVDEVISDNQEIITTSVTYSFEGKASNMLLFLKRLEQIPYLVISNVSLTYGKQEIATDGETKQISDKLSILLVFKQFSTNYVESTELLSSELSPTPAQDDVSVVQGE